MSTKNLNYDLYLAAPVGKVWQALTDGTLTRQYFYGTRVTGSFKKGSSIQYLGEGDVNMMDGEIIEIAPEKRLVTTCRALWDDSVKKDKPSRLTWELTPAGNATRLTLLHDGFDDANATYEQSARGWPVILSSMKTLVETGRPLVLQ